MNHIFKCGTLIPSLKHLVLGRQHLFEVKFMSALHQIKHQYSPNSPPTVLFPSLEVFEVYHVHHTENPTDNLILKFIISRTNETRSNTGVSKLRKVLVHSWATGGPQEDTVSETLAYAEAAGIELEIKFGGRDKFDWSWSPSFVTISGAKDLSESISNFAFRIPSFCQFPGDFDSFQDSRNPETWKPGNY